MNRVLPAALAAIGAGAGFGNPLFSLPALTSLRYRALELEWLLLPTVAAVMVVAVVGGARWIPGRGYPFAAVGGLAGSLAIVLADKRTGGPDVTVAWILVIAAAGGLVLGGLAVAAGSGTGPERLALGAGLAAGIAVSNPVWDGLRAQTWPPFLIHLLVFVVAVVGAALAWHDDRPARAVGVMGVIVAVGVIVMAGLVARNAVMEELRLPGFGGYSAVGVAVVAALVPAWHAYRLGGADLARWPVLAFALAAPITMLASGLDDEVSSDGAVGFAVAVGAALAGGALAGYLDRLAPWEALGVLAAATGLVVGAAFDGFGPAAYVMVLGGAAFALGAGLARTAALPAGGAGVGLGLAAMLLSAQALGPVTLELVNNTTALRGAQLVAPAASALAALVIIVLFARHRPTEHLPRELLAQAA